MIRLSVTTACLLAVAGLAHAAVRQRFADILASHPGLTRDHPYFKTVKGERWLKQYTDPKAAEKHLHNHRDYECYDETLPNTQTSATDYRAE